MPSEEEYADRAKRLLRTEMVRRNVGYDEMAKRLTMLGMPDTAVNLRNKVNRGKFTAAFLLAVCDALEVSTLRTSEV